MVQRYCHGGGREGVVVMGGGGLVQRYCHGGGREGDVLVQHATKVLSWWR